jgi:hypothetical protein
MRRRFPPEALGTAEEREEYARLLFDRHLVRRRGLGMPDPDAPYVASNVEYLAISPTYIANEAERREREVGEQANDTLLAPFDGRQVSASDVNRLATTRLDADRPGIRGAERCAAIAAIEAEVRQALERRRQAFATTAASRREAELARLASSNLADMPREILRAAEENLADARSPFEMRPNWRPDPVALRQEEVRLRGAVAQRIEIANRAAAASAQAAADAVRRDMALQQCRKQAAMIGAGVPTSYPSRGMGGILGAAVVGAIRQAETEANALQACMRGAGY